MLDDEISEALPLLYALSKLRIGALYCDGTEETIPEPPLGGVRLIFLDLRLAGSPTAEPRHFIAQTLSILNRLVKVEYCPAGIIYWTKHEEDKEQFAIQLAQDMPKFRPAFVLGIENKLHLYEHGHSDQIGQILREKLDNLPGCGLLWDWEQAVHDAATRAAELLWELAGPPLQAPANAGPDHRLLELFCTLSIANGARQDDDAATSLRHLFASLNPLYYDHLESRAAGIGGNRSYLAQFREIISANPKLTEAEKSRLNAIFLMSRLVPMISV